MKQLTSVFLALFISQVAFSQEWTAIKLDTRYDRLNGSIASHKGKLFVTTIANNLMVSTDGGNSFKDIENDAVKIARFLVSAGNRLYSAGNEGIIGYTLDEGKTYITDTINLPYDESSFTKKPGAEEFFSYNGGTKLWCFLGSKFGTYQKSVSASTWTKVSTLDSLSPTRFTFKNDTIFMVNTSNVYMSTNDGQSWKQLNNKGLPMNFYTGCFHKSENRLYLMAETKRTSRGDFAMYYTEDLGNTWDTLAIKHVLDEDENDWLQRPFNMITNGPDIWISLGKSGFLDPLQFISSHDGGKTFTKDNKGTITDYHYDGVARKFEIHDGKVFALSVRQVIYSQPLSSPVNTQEIDQNVIRAYPNPADNYLTVNLNEIQSTNFYVYNAMGQIVLMSQFVKNQPIDISSLEPGMYIAQMGNAHFSFVKK